MTVCEPSATFRDPAGSLVVKEDHAVRFIRPEFRAEVLEFLDSAFYCAAVQRGDMIASEVEGERGQLRLIHPRVRIPTYPWEWTQSQWFAAADLTLRLCEEALDSGWILKDATPLNVLFDGPKPVLVDVLSFERRDPASSIWLPYGQYVRTFLLPLLMKKMLRWPLELSLFRRDGLEPVELYRALGWRQRLSRAAFWPVTLPAWLERRSNDAAGATAVAKVGGDPELALHTLKRMLAGLRKRTRAALPKESRSEWAEYTGALTHYTELDTEQKKTWIRVVMEELQPSHVLDVGANTGEFSALATVGGAEVVALERDAEAAERIARMSAGNSLPIQTIHADLARPTPAAGWENGEAKALLPRLEGRFELVMLLAVIHHLILLEQIPLSAIMELCHRLTRRSLVVEWVPATDPMYVSLMRGRDALYGRLSESNLLDATTGLFRTVRRHALGNGRVLFLFERIDDGAATAA